MLDRRYKTLAVLAKTLSYTKTAQHLFITQPAVSQQISNLEQELEVKLVAKNGVHIHLTSAGEQLVQYVDRILLENEHVLQQIRTNSEEPIIKIGATYSLSTFLLPRLIKNLLPTTTKIHTLIDNTAEILTALRQGEVELGLVEGNFDKNEFDAITIQNEEFIGVTSQKNPLLDKTTITIADLLPEVLLIRESGSGTRAIFANWLATQNYQINEFNQQIEIANPTTIIELLKSDVGISFMYKSLIKSELDKSTLVELPLDGFKITHPINLIFLKESYFAKYYTEIAKKLSN
ncbi:LysR family transcriptional regulator [Loigolactobacillus backii]|uniref:Transcriptional regulator n=1 Tax=Loigolactobacillus backii TaxID=375175 RepID=A0A192H192_9LACO|nr:LysR family transcriptional regulator [Loigolactobacillus backii]ANK60717.1 transcriptional regulator [Loigolactobacillus backii]ANK61716.1 transcriptional regulator [Loigolactobacillus backii]ANK65670.1 transcriptional regulator [Loigolactobacillus backii]ANK68147.1 transcriptional regulator [Loigolactobacillus backii]ANK69087.1 transcriptional regulator [Loigolactobacillus backii]